jgi:hypothetical protein
MYFIIHDKNTVVCLFLVICAWVRGCRSGHKNDIGATTLNLGHMFTRVSHNKGHVWNDIQDVSKKSFQIF